MIFAKVIFTKMVILSQTHLVTADQTPEIRATVQLSNNKYNPTPAVSIGSDMHDDLVFQLSMKENLTLEECFVKLVEAGYTQELT